jgi:hypothetical protein
MWKLEVASVKGRRRRRRRRKEKRTGDVRNNGEEEKPLGDSPPAASRRGDDKRFGNSQGTWIKLSTANPRAAASIVTRPIKVARLIHRSRGTRNEVLTGQILLVKLCDLCTKTGCGEKSGVCAEVWEAIERSTMPSPQRKIPVEMVKMAKNAKNAIRGGPKGSARLTSPTPQPSPPPCISGHVGLCCAREGRGGR